MHDQKHFMQEALLQAQKAYKIHEVPVGAVIVCDNVIVAYAHNNVQAMKDATAHAELLALRLACNKLQAKYLPTCTLYVTLEPCPMCATATYWTQIGQIIFATKDPKKGYSLWEKPLLHPKTKVTQGILTQTSSQLLQKFFQKLRKKPTIEPIDPQMY